MTSIYVGNLPHASTEQEIEAAFSQHGTVASVNIIKDRETGKSRGFAFVEMPDGAEAATAIEQLNLTEIGGRSITVNEARPKKEGGGGGGRGPRRGGGGGYGGGGGRRW